MKAKPTKHLGEVRLELSARDGSLLAAVSNQSTTSPFRLNKILVPIDFSDCSKKALRYAIPLAKQHQAGIALLYVVAAPAYYAVGDGGGFNYLSFEPDYASVEAEMRVSGERQLSALAATEARGETTA